MQNQPFLEPELVKQKPLPLGDAEVAKYAGKEHHLETRAWLLVVAICARPTAPRHYKMKIQPFLPELVKHLSGGESPWGTF